MKVVLTSFLAGIIFAIGLVVSGMTNPQKVIGFLDIFGSWDYSLAFVMGGAVGVNLISFSFLKKKSPVFSPKFYLPSKKDIDGKLIGGAILFGAGWGIAGICPGPGIVNLAMTNMTSVIFIGSMILGMVIYKVVAGRYFPAGGN